MELLQDLLFTALIALLFSYLVAKLVSFSMAAGGDSASPSDSVVEELKEVDADADHDVILEELQFGEKMNTEILESQNKVEAVEQETVEKVDKFEQVVESTEGDSSISNDVIVQSEELNIVGRDSNEGLLSNPDDGDDDDDDDDDDWEGIERSELENVFAKAVKFVEESDSLSDMQMELYALHKIATEGPCRDSQPLPLMISARSKWNAWLNLGNMDQEDAMEQYIALLNDRVPGWMKENCPVDDRLEPNEIGKPDALVPLDSSSFTREQTDFTHERNPESGSEVGGLTGVSSTEPGAKE